MVGIAAGNLYDVNAQAVHQSFQFRYAGDLQRPAAHANRQGFNSHPSNSLK
jgi:hypothetical protein